MKQLGTDERPLRVALVGAGPTGFYTADKILKSSLSVKIDLFEQWPVPYGLVRTGVAPDKQNTKNITRLFERIAGNPSIRYLGNVKVGHDLEVEDLQRCYDVVVFTCGASSHRRLGIPGEDLPGSYSANEFVGWYNGDPNYQDLAPDLSVDTALVIGNGNVAMDVTRILARPAEVLAASDIPVCAARAMGGS
jgi:ferredoxin--NADP+ reductase